MNAAPLIARARGVAAKLAQRLTRVRGGPTRPAPARVQVGGPLDAINDRFHDAYAQARGEVEGDAPVIVVLADELVMLRRGQRRAWPASPRVFHVIKSVSHAPLAIYIEHERLLRSRANGLDGDARTRLSAQRERLRESVARLANDGDGLSERTRADLEQLLEASHRYLGRSGAQPSRDVLSAFAAEVGPTLMRLIDDATALQLELLDRHAREALEPLSARELSQLQVVVTGDHQARVRSLPMQYFQHLLGEASGSERRVVYAEGVSDEQGALALAATRRLDRAIGRDFFGDPARLQRDLLGDAAHARLKAANLTPIDAR